MSDKELEKSDTSKNLYELNDLEQLDKLTRDPGLIIRQRGKHEPTIDAHIRLVEEFIKRLHS